MENLSNTNKKSHPFDWKTAAALVAANFFFGSNIIAVKLISPRLIDPLGLAYARMLISSLLMILVPYVLKSNEKIEPKDRLLLVFAAILGITGNQIFSIFGIAFTNPIHASLLNMATPIIVSLMAAIFIGERFGGNKIIGLLLGIGGAAILIMARDTMQTRPASVLGDVLVVTASFCYSSYLILIRSISSKYTPLTILRFVFIVGTIISIPICGKSFLAAQWSSFSFGDWYALFHIIILGTFIAYLLMNMGVSKWGPSRTGSFVYFQPFFGTLSAMVVMNEKLTIVKVMAGVLIILGVWVTSLQAKKNVQ